MQNIKEYLSYDPETGIFTWVKKPAKGITINSIAGCVDGKGYIQITYKGKHYQAHRLVWRFIYGYMPEHNIDHVNEIKGDNRLCNLRLDINRENEQNNSKPQSNNSSGYRGIYWYKRDKKWISKIQLKGKTISIGRHDTPEEAHAAYLCAKRELHPFWVEGKD